MNNSTRRDFAPTLRDEIDAATSDRLAADLRNPGCFWGTSGRTLSRDEAAVFGIAYADFPRMVTVWEAWFAFLGLIEAGTVGHSSEAIERERQLHPALMGGNDPEPFIIFAKDVGGLTERQAEAMYWKDWFWTVREGHVRYADEPVGSPEK